MYDIPQKSLIPNDYIDKVEKNDYIPYCIFSKPNLMGFYFDNRLSVIIKTQFDENTQNKLRDILNSIDNYYIQLYEMKIMLNDGKIIRLEIEKLINSNGTIIEPKFLFRIIPSTNNEYTQYVAYAFLD